MALDATDFKTLFPEFSTVADGDVETWLDFAECSVCLDRLPDCMADKAHGFLAAHYLSLALKRASDSSTATTGEVSSMSVGDVSVSFKGDTSQASQSAFAAELSGTQYGRIFYGLFRRYTFAAYSTGMVT